MAEPSDPRTLLQSLTRNALFKHKQVIHKTEVSDQSPGEDIVVPSDQPAKTTEKKPPPPAIKPKPTKNAYLQLLAADSNQSVDTASVPPQQKSEVLDTKNPVGMIVSTTSSQLTHLPSSQKVRQLEDKSNAVVADHSNDCLQGNNSSLTSAQTTVLPPPTDAAAQPHPVATTIANDSLPTSSTTNTSHGAQVQTVVAATALRAAACDDDEDECIVPLPTPPSADSKQMNYSLSIESKDDHVQQALLLSADVGIPTSNDSQQLALPAPSPSCQPVRIPPIDVPKMVPSGSRGSSLPRQQRAADLFADNRSYDSQRKHLHLDDLILGDIFDGIDKATKSPVTPSAKARTAQRMLNIDYSALLVPPQPSLKSDRAYVPPSCRSKSALSLDNRSKSRQQKLKKARNLSFGNSSHDNILGGQSQSTANDALLMLLSGTPLAYDWQFQDNIGNWQAYDYELAVMLERMYLVDPNSSTQFESDEYRYSVDFSTMQQTNEKTSKKRPIRRIDNPNFESKNAEADSATGEATTESDEFTRMVAAFIPKTWKADANEIYSGCRLVEVPNSGETSQEYKEIAELFRKTAFHKRLQSVKRIENRDLYIAFYLHKTQTEGQRRKKINVRRLFHGTKDKYIDAICQRGFDFRLHGSTTGCLYGRGSYFARDAKYSLDYAECGKMLVVQVTVGDYVEGDSSMYRPPPRDPSVPHGDLYDSCVDNVKNPSIFVTFERWQSYPEYLLEFT